MKKLVFILFIAANAITYKAAAADVIVKCTSVIDTMPAMPIMPSMDNLAGTYSFTGLSFQVMQVSVLPARQIHISAEGLNLDVASVPDNPFKFEIPDYILEFIRGNGNTVVGLRIITKGMAYISTDKQ